MIGILANILVIAAGALADNATYLSRTDLKPSLLDVSTYEADLVSDGYIYAAPWSPGQMPQAQPYLGPHIYSSDGNLTWCGYGYLGNSISNFMPATYHGRPAITFFEGNVDSTGVGLGSFRIMDEKFEVVAKLGILDSYLHDFHEFQMTGPDTAAFSTYRSVPYNFSGIKEANENSLWVYENIVTEINTSTDEVLFQWNSLDHVLVNDSRVKYDIGLKGNDSDTPFDYMHLNAITKDEHGNFLISCRHLWSLYYISGKTGEIIWTMGNSYGGSDWVFEGVETEFAFQHHARWVDPSYIGQPKEDNVSYISLFDNGKGSSDEQPFRKYSRVIILKLDGNPDPNLPEGKIGKLTLVQEYRPEKDIVCASQGSAQVLPNGNVFIGWGSTAKVTEHLFNGTTVFEADLNNGKYVSYRAFKADFQGTPRDKPAILPIYDASEDKTYCYISWNGATSTNSWNIYGGDDSGSLELIGNEVPRDGFETKYELNGNVKWVKVEAVNDNGGVIGSNTVKSTF